MTDDKRFAVLIDADNVSSKYVKIILDEISDYGVATYKKNLWRLDSISHNILKDVLLENSITPIQQYNYTVGKNSTDAAMIIDAMDVLYSGNVEGFCIASSDSDFTRLASRLRESGMFVVGMGEKKTPKPFIVACNQFKYLDVLAGDDGSEPSTVIDNEGSSLIYEDNSKSNGSRKASKINNDDDNDLSKTMTDIEQIKSTVYKMLSEIDAEDQSMNMGELGSKLVKRYPDFDVRNYGYRKLSKFLGKFDALDIMTKGKDGTSMWVSLNENYEEDSEEENVSIVDLSHDNNDGKKSNRNPNKKNYYRKIIREDINNNSYNRVKVLIYLTVELRDIYEYPKKAYKRKQVSPVYLIYGEEQDYLKLLYKDKLREAIIGEDLSMNYSYYEGKYIDPIEVIDKAKTLPFFSDRRLIIIENSDFFEVQSPLADSLDTLPESTYMIFVAKKVDKRGKLFKQIKKLGHVTEFNELSSKDLKLFIASLLKEGKKRITGQSADYLIDKTGTDMLNIQNEIEKLISYAYERDIITNEDIDAVCIEQTENKIFQMIDAITEREKDTALNLYYDLISLKEKPRSILRLLIRHFKILLQVKSLDRLRVSNQEIARKVGVHPYFVSKYIGQGRKFTVPILKNNLILCNNAEGDFNAGNMDDQLGVEVLIIQFASNN